MKKLLSCLFCISILAGCGPKDEPASFDETKLNSILESAADDNQAFEMVVQNMNDQLTYMRTEGSAKHQDGTLLYEKTEEKWKVDGKYAYQSKNDFSDGNIIWSIVGTEKMTDVTVTHDINSTVSEENVTESQNVPMFSYEKGSFDLTVEKTNDGAIFKASFSVPSQDGVTQIDDEYTVNKAGFITSRKQHAVNDRLDITYDFVYKDFNANVPFDYEKISNIIKELDNKTYDEVKEAFYAN